MSAKAVLVRKIDGLSGRTNQRLPCAKGVTDDGGLIFLASGESEPEIIHSGEVSIRI